MKLIGPDRIEPVAAAVHRSAPHELGVVEVRFGDDEQRAAGMAGQLAHRRAKLLEDGQRRGVDDGVNRIQPQPVAVIVPQPHQGVVDDERPHLGAVRAVEVDGVAPVGGVTVGEVGAELRQVVAGRTQMVVHHVDHHPDAAGVAGIDQPLEAIGSAVAVVGGEQVDTVVAPPPISPELGDGQQLDGVDAERDQVIQPGHHGVERALGSEGADVQLVQDGRGEIDAPPAPVGPDEGAVVDNPRRPVNARGLPGGARIRPRWAAVEAVAVVVSGAGVVNVPGPPPVVMARHLEPLPGHHELDGRRSRRPDPESLAHGADSADGSASCAKTATGKSENRSAALIGPPGYEADVNTSTHDAVGRLTVVSPQSPSSKPVASLGTTTARPPARPNATTWESLAPCAVSGWYPDSAEYSSGRRRRWSSTR